LWYVTVQSQPSLAANFLYQYPTRPKVLKAIGCTTDPKATSTIINCPTTGGVTLGLLGTNFDAGGVAASIGVTIGGLDCIESFSNSTYIECELGPGTGQRLPVRVQSGDIASLAVPLVSYGIPFITQLPGCFGITRPINCDRLSTPTITIIGHTIT
jgi:hypothetical protein